MLTQKLIEYTNSTAYPFHMPGHKRRDLDFPSPFSIDITEITGFDDLHHSDGILADAQNRAADLYGADDAFYLVNGSTCGILAAISAATQKGDSVLVARNSHKSVYHALYLRELVPEYIYPEISAYQIQGQINPVEIEKKLSKNSRISAVIITSPTYDGVVSDVGRIADIVHAHGCVLIVDAAHGAHFGLHDSMPENPISLGADAVVVSVHKTLPAMTQTALLLTKGERINKAKIEKFLDIYETSSPSYVLMAGIDNCVRIMKENGKQLFEEMNTNLDEFYYRMTGLEKLKVLEKKDFADDEAYEFDRTKIIISTVNCDISGNQLKKILTEQYNIELEMSSEAYGLALATVMDTAEGFRRLAEALLGIDRKLQGKKSGEIILSAYQKQERKYEIHETDGLQREEVALEAAINQISGEYIYFYPPGIPILVPGEVISQENVESVSNAINSGIEVYGLTENKMIFILKG